MTVSTTTAPKAAARAPATPQAPATGAVWGALLWKECREVAPVIGLIALAWSLIWATILWGAAGRMVENFESSAAPMLNIAAICGPIAALIVGFAQHIRESRPDRLGLLLHRPVARSTLFWCKTAAGLGLCVPALALPVLAAYWWASNPANVPQPFTWSMLLAPLADILSGVPYYFAGILVAQRMDARWYGARLLPVAAPIVASVAEVIAPTFGWALLWSGLATLLLALAARGQFVGAGQYGPMKPVARGAFGGAIFAALMLLLVVGLGLLAGLLEPSSYQTTYSQSLDMYLADGTPVHAESQTGKPYRITDFSGRAVAGDPTKMLWSPQPVQGDMDLRRGYYSRFHEPGYYFIRAFMTGTTDSVIWYAANNGGNYFVGFGDRNNRYAGVLGADGLEAGAAVPLRALARPLHGVRASAKGDAVISAGDTIYRLTGNLKFAPLWHMDGPILKLGQFYGARLPRDNPPAYVMAATANEIAVLEPGEPPKVLFRYALPDAERWHISALRFESTGQFLVTLRPRQMSAEGQPLSARALYLHPDGTLDHELALPGERQEYVRTPTAADVVPKYVYPPLAPPVVFHGLEPALRWLGPNFQPSDLSLMTDTRATILNGIGALMSAAAMHVLLRRRRLAASQIWLWTILTLATGPLGILLRLCTSGLPVTAACPHCATRHPLTDTHCPACGTAPATPPRNGSEVFA
jgi:hypothetical protein